MKTGREDAGKKFKAYYHSPIGTIEIVGNEQGISGLEFARARLGRTPPPHPSLKPALRQIEEYFLGERREFSLKLSLRGTEFQKRVWAELGKIPFGQTCSYGDLAKAIGRTKAARAVGGANHRNPVSIIVPCHRVIGSDGKLVGYGGGLWRKEWLLRHERERTKKGK